MKTTKKIRAIYKVMKAIARMGGIEHEKDYSQGKKTEKACAIWQRAQDEADLSDKLGRLLLLEWGRQYPIKPLREMRGIVFDGRDEDLPQDEAEIFDQLASFADATLIGNHPWSYCDREWKRYAKGFPGPEISKKLECPVKTQGTVYALVWNDHTCDDDYVREYWSSHIQLFATKEEAEKACTGSKKVIALRFGEQAKTIEVSRFCD